MNLDDIPSDLAVQLAVLEMRRKYPDLSGKGAALIWNDQDNEISFRNFFPLSVIKKQKIKDLRREVKREFARIESDGLTGTIKFHKNYHPKCAILKIYFLSIRCSDTVSFNDKR